MKLTVPQGEQPRDEWLQWHLMTTMRADPPMGPDLAHREDQGRPAKGSTISVEAGKVSRGRDLSSWIHGHKLRHTQGAAPWASDQVKQAGAKEDLTFLLMLPEYATSRNRCLVVFRVGEATVRTAGNQEFGDEVLWFFSVLPVNSKCGEQMGQLSKLSLQASPAEWLGSGYLFFFL